MSVSPAPIRSATLTRRYQHLARMHRHLVQMHQLHRLATTYVAAPLQTSSAQHATAILLPFYLAGLNASHLHETIWEFYSVAVEFTTL